MIRLIKRTLRQKPVRPQAWRPLGPLGIVVLAGLAAGLAACDDLARRDLVARTGDWTLSEDRLAELLVLAQPFPLDSISARELVRHWEGTAALALRTAAGDSLLGSEALEAATWLDRREVLLAAEREDRLGSAVAVSLETAEAAFREGSLRLLAHVVRHVGPETSSAEQRLQRQTAERILASLVDGGPWNQAVAESEDLASRNQAGLLGLFARGELPSNLDRAAFQLGPGQVSSVLQTRQGFHILYRPRFEEVSRLFAGRLRERRLAEADASASEETREERAMEIAPAAVEVLRGIAREPGAWLHSVMPLATWTGGSLAAGDVARYATFLPALSRAELASADAEARSNLIRELATREVRLAGLEERGIGLDDAMVDALAEAHADEIEYWTQALELDDSGVASRAALARHMEAVVSRQGQPRSLSPLLEAWLLERAGTRVRDEGVLAAIVKARAMLAGAGGANANGEGP